MHDLREDLNDADSHALLANISFLVAEIAVFFF